MLVSSLVHGGKLLFGRNRKGERKEHKDRLRKRKKKKEKKIEVEIIKEKK